MHSTQRGWVPTKGDLASPVIFICDDVPRLAIQGLADGFQGRESARARLAVFQNGNIGHGDVHFLGALGHAHLSLGEHDIDVDLNCHTHLSHRQIVPGFISTALFKIRSNIAAVEATTIAPR